MSLEKTEISGIYRESSGALINNDTDALIAYKKKKQAQKELEKFMQTVKENQDKIAQLEMTYKKTNSCTHELLEYQKKEIEEMKTDLIEIKQLLLKITNK
jgi:septal ring factor EnvC (AmiA/AmiB activator)